MRKTTLYDDFIALAVRETGRRTDDITSLWWNNQGGKLNGMVEIDGEMVRIGEPAPDPAPRLSEKYWDCNCEEKYIHRNSIAECPVCGAFRNQMPDSRQNEVDEGIHFAEV